MKQEANHRDSDSSGFNSYVEGETGMLTSWGQRCKKRTGVPTWITGMEPFLWKEEKVERKLRLMKGGFALRLWFIWDTTVPTDK